MNALEDSQIDGAYIDRSLQRVYAESVNLFHVQADALVQICDQWKLSRAFQRPAGYAAALSISPLLEPTHILPQSDSASGAP